jgi:hypothetical protein
LEEEEEEAEEEEKEEEKTLVDTGNPHLYVCNISLLRRVWLLGQINLN